MPSLFTPKIRLASSVCGSEWGQWGHAGCLKELSAQRYIAYELQLQPQKSKIISEKKEKMKVRDEMRWFIFIFLQCSCSWAACYKRKMECATMLQCTKTTHWITGANGK
jgi:hypothetical protein